MADTNNNIKGYMVFNSDWTCGGYQYTCPGVFEEDVVPSICCRGFCLCRKVSDCFRHHSFNLENKVAEVIAIGDVDIIDDTKFCTNKIQIVREISWQELLDIVNDGKACTGLHNTGNWNTGSKNTGDWNTGNMNTGGRNIGSRNTGNMNSGDRNTGNWNIGSMNTGDWNISSYNTGCFMTKEPKISMFDKPSEWSYIDWLDSDALRLLEQIPKNLVEWICEEDMSDEEKVECPTYKTTGGYLKVLDESECAQIWWDGLGEGARRIIKSIPNFDAEIFEKCTGIKIEHGEESNA